MNGVNDTSSASFKRRLRSCVDRVADWSGLLAGLERRMRRGVTALMYHRVLPDDECAGYPFESLVMPMSAFEQQVEWLAQHCTVVPLLEALALLDDRAAGEEPQQPLVAITFDDGYADNFDIAAPILESAGVRGTFFITTQPVESQRMLWFDVVATAYFGGLMADLQGTPAGAMFARHMPFGDFVESLKRMPHQQRTHLVNAIADEMQSLPLAEQFRMMTIDHVRELSRRGHEIGGHTATHPILPLLGEHELARELVESRAALEDWTGIPVTGLAYPNGDHDDRVVQAAMQAGYAYACSTTAGLHERGLDVMRVRRIDITPQRVCTVDGAFSERSFRSELCQLREVWR